MFFLFKTKPNIPIKKSVKDKYMDKKNKYTNEFTLELLFLE